MFARSSRCTAGSSCCGFRTERASCPAGRTDSTSGRCSASERLRSACSTAGDRGSAVRDSTAAIGCATHASSSHGQHETQGGRMHTRQIRTTYLTRSSMLLAAVLIAACADAEPRAPLEPLALESRRIDEARLFAPGTISDSRWQWRITFTPDGRTAYFTTSDDFFPATRRATIMVSHLQRDGTWSTPEVAPFSGTWPDIDPFLTPDGRRLYFSSIRPIDGREKPDLDIFYVERTPRGWREPVRLGPEVNSDLDELYPSLSADGTLYFGVGPFGPTPEADWDIYYAARRGRGFAPRQPITEINTDLPWDPSDPTADWEFNPEISV